MARGDPQFNVRLSPCNREWLEKKANENRRSLTGQMNWLIEDERRKEEIGKELQDEKLA